MKKNFNQILENAKTNIQFWLQGAIVDFTEEVVRRMGEENVTRAELADKINVNRAYITKILRGDTNFTLATMVKVARALNSNVRIHLQREDCQSEWIEFLKNEPVSSLPNSFDGDWNDSAFQTDKKIIKFENEPVTAAA